MEILRVSRANAGDARGIVIVIDVIRAFTVAGYAFAGGARGLWLVRTVEEAQALHTREPEALLAGEVDGRLIPGFDLNNSPVRVASTDLRGKLVIQRTGAGTQGAVGAVNASHVLLCALTNARATAAYARRIFTATGDPVTLLPTGDQTDFVFGSEDVICADYVEALLRGQEDAPVILAGGIAQLRSSGRFALWKHDDPDFPYEDIANVLEADRFGFAILGAHRQWQDITYVDAHRVD
jgi:2-phosphosulfolactate phosphatase